MIKQLYSRHLDVEYDELSTPVVFAKSLSRPLTSKSTMFSFNWPNGSPCIYAELYLQSKSFEIVENNSGTSSLNTIASQLSHIVRFCWTGRKDFWELDQNDIEDFVYVLMQERDPHDPNQARRNNNTVNEIVSGTVDFIVWLQNNIFLNLDLIGGDGDKSKIRLKSTKFTDWQGNQKMVSKFPHLPPRATRNPKAPIAREVIGRLWSAVTAMSDPARKSKRYLHKFDNEKEALEELMYLKKRRELLLYLLEATGARPGELSLLTVSQNEQPAKDNKITLRTFKRRRFSERAIPIEASVAVKLELFINVTRKKLISKLGTSANPENRVFLTVEGKPYGVESMTREFSRIAEMAGQSDVQACMSMFRHRFITTMVIIHLKAFMAENKGKLRANLNLSDYRSILKRVATFTGHASEDSLMHYIDMAWEEMRLFDYVEPTITAITKAEGVISELQSIVSSELLSQHIEKGKLSNAAFLKTLQTFLDDRKEVFENFKTLKTGRIYPDGEGG